MEGLKIKGSCMLAFLLYRFASWCGNVYQGDWVVEMYNGRWDTKPAESEKMISQ